MKRIALLGLIVLFAGCGRCWLPIFRGAPCHSGCGLTAPALPASHETGCVGCANGVSAGYGSYDNEVYSGGDAYYDSAVVNNGIVGGVPSGIVSEGVISSPSMVPLSTN